MSKKYSIISQKYTKKGHNMTNQTARVLELIKRFNDGQIIKISDLQNDELWKDKSEKTIRRDLDVIKEYFPDSFVCVRGEGGAYKAITKGTFENFLDAKVLSFFAIAYNLASKNQLFESFGFDENAKNVLKSKLKTAKACYNFVSKPFESLENKDEILKSLEFAILYKRKINLIYQSREKLDFKGICPYKIVFMNENFYLLCASELGVSKFRITHIKSVDILSSTFYANADINEFINTMQTPFAEYGVEPVNVLLQIDKCKAKFFKSKKFYKSQKIERELENGDIIVSFSITSFNEIKSFILSWLSFVSVIEPSSLKYEINELLENSRV